LQPVVGKKIFLLLCLAWMVSTLQAQVLNTLPDSLHLRPGPDSLMLLADTLAKPAIKPKVDVVDSPVDYKAADSLEIDPVNQKVYLYGDANVKYKNITLDADYIEFDMAKNEVFAKGMPDSSGTVSGKPVFTEGSDKYDSEFLRYNFKTKKGYIQKVVTEQEGGFLHSKTTKREPGGVINLKDGKYTSCDAANPHYYVALTKAKVLPKNKIVSGPAYLVIEDIPLPLVLPFGFFPNKKGQASGILIPQYGEEMNRGFFLREGGYYFAVNKYMDLRVTGDIYTKGTWGARIGSQYVRKYKFSGNVDLKYYKNVSGDKDIGTQTASRDYSVNWSHRQDPKSSPNSTFSANVNMSSSSYDKNHSYSTESYLTNTKSSSISFTRRWPNSPFNFSGSFNHQQNSLNKTVTLGLPRLTFNVSRIYPFRGKKSAGKSRWYDNIELSYSSMLDNTINTTDSAFLTSRMFDNMRNGFKHTIPLSTAIRPFSNFSISPSVMYTGVLYTQSIHKSWNADYYNASTNSYGRVEVDTIKGLRYAHSYQPSISMSLNPRIYGMFQFVNPNARIQAIRHVIQPSVSVSLVPDIRSITPDYYDTVQTNADGSKKQVYSIFEGGIYGTPTVAGGKSGSVNFALNNNLEMKVRSSRDTSGQLKKVKLLESLNFSTNYNIFADSMNWSPINISGRTNLFNKINITFGGTVDMYALNSAGNRINQFQWSVDHKLGRLTRAFLSLDMSLNSSSSSSSSSTAPVSSASIPTKGEAKNPDQPVKSRASPAPVPVDYVNFDIPWNLSIRYSLNYSKMRFDKNITQTLNFSGSLSLTPKWKISFSSGWDFVANKLTYTSVNLHRDLHCWEMSFSWIPIGYHQSYAFQINVLSAILRDLKYEKRKSWYDRPGGY
jgi:hypothetical protein